MCNEYSQSIKEFNEFIRPEENIATYHLQLICTKFLPEVWENNKKLLDAADALLER